MDTLSLKRENYARLIDMETEVRLSVKPLTHTCVEINTNLSISRPAAPTCSETPTSRLVDQTPDGQEKHDRPYPFRFSPDHTTSMLASIFDDLEQLWKDVAVEKCKLQEFENLTISGIQQQSNHWKDGSSRQKETPEVNALPIASSCCQANHFSRRKPAKPVRSAARNDPSFRGVTVVMKTKVRDGDSKLVILSSFTPRKISKPIQSRIHRNSTGTAESCSDSEDTTPPSVKQPLIYISSKIPWRYSCASCDTRKTPLWRDAEDGTRLCNACGIRYKKYRVRCSRCWHIPKKDGKSYPHCPRCGALLSMSSCRRSW